MRVFNGSGGGTLLSSSDVVEPFVMIELRLLLLSADPIECVSPAKVPPLAVVAADLLLMVGVAMLGGLDRRFSFSTSERSGRFGCSSSVNSKTGAALVGVVAVVIGIGETPVDRRLTGPPLSRSEDTILELCSLAVDMGLV